MSEKPAPFIVDADKFKIPTGQAKVGAAVIYPTTAEQSFLVEGDQTFIKDADVQKNTLDAVNVYFRPTQTGEFYAAGFGLGIDSGPDTLADLSGGVQTVTLPHRLPDDQIGPTPPDDERRFLAVSMRKVEEIEKQIAKLLNECQQYPGIDPRHLNIFRTHCEIGMAFAHKALYHVQITDDGK